MADDFGRQLADLLYGSERSESDSAPSDRFRGVSDKLLGTGMRGAITRALLGFDPPEDATGAEMEAYRNFANASTALAVGPAGVVKAMRGTKAAKAAKPAYPQAEALERARQNAVKMLNLPENNTPEMRAQAMGYIDYLHGTQRLDRLLEGKTLDPRRATSGPMPYGTTTPELASSYATSKADTSRRATDEGDVRRYFEVAPKDIGIQGLRSPLPVETAWHFMSPEQQAKIRELAPRVGYENLDEFTGNLIVHPEGVNATLSPNQWNWLMKNEAKGNPLAALRHMWYESGQLVDEPETLGQIYRLAGVNAPISQTKAPWTEAQGVLLGKARITNPIDTSNTEQVSALIEPLKQAFARDRSRTKAGGPDQWAKDSRYTPRSWVSELEKDLAEGKESYVWTSIPDKVTAELRRLGFNGIIDRSGKGGGAKEPVVIPFNPAQVRSRFAAFDPAEMDKPDLLKKTGGRVHISDNPDTMRLEMAVGGPVIGGALKYFGVPRLIGGLAERAMKARLTSLIESGMPLDQIHNDAILNALALLPTKSGLEQSAEEIGRMTSAPQPFVDPSQEMMTGGYDWRPAEESVVDAMYYYDPLSQNRSDTVSREIPIDLQGSTELVTNTPMEDYLKYGGRDDDLGSDQDASYGQTSMPATEVRFDEQLIDPISGNPYTLGDESSNSAENDALFGGAIIDSSPKIQQQESASMFATGGAAKKRRKVSFTDNLDTMRLAVQKRK